jgi:hypothetical protein
MAKRTDTRAYITGHRHAGVNRKNLPAASDTLGAVTVYMGGAALYDPVENRVGAVNVLDPRGNEVMRVHRLDENDFTYSG